PQVIADYTRNIQINSVDQARSFFENFIFHEGIPLKLKLKNGRIRNFPFLAIYEKENFTYKYEFFFEFFEAISFCLYKKFPEYFFPYFFDRKDFFTFMQICENFEITIPNFPPRNNWLKRVWFYFDLSISLNEFRKHINLPPPEFVALIYDFGIKSLIKITKEELSNPLKAWFIGGGEWDYDTLDDANENSSYTWGAGNERIKRGDIILMYCTAPRSYIHSIWRATSDSFINPFAHYYYVVNIGFPLKIKPINYHSLSINPILKKNPTVKGHMQGLNGRPVTQIEFAELLRLIKESGINISEFPQLPVFNHSSNHIQDERDVEIELIEPLLFRLGFKSEDWMRQMPIRMGRGIRYFPDYSIIFNSKRGEESAKIVVEAKFEILSEKQLEEAYLQAKSYAVRLRSYIFLVADKDNLYLFEQLKDTFELTNRIKYSWPDLDNPDTFHSFKEKVRK
ncbi:MAG: hypothetical protein Q8907_14610, partial [Bacteroidota bacterium]|nr:hypothetical protein [Bacteroidota bacterium]